MFDLSNIKEIKSADPSGYLPILRHTPSEIKQVWEQFKDNSQITSFSFDKVVVCAMGGSAIGADMAKFVIEKYSSLPIQIVRDYQLPNWVDSQTLAIIISYSGNTEETISGYLAAVDRGAHVFCLASGGQLLTLAQQNTQEYFVMPPNLPPRTAWGHSFFIVLELLVKLGKISADQIDLSGSIQAMEQAVADNCEDIASDQNLAKQIASVLANSIPIVFGAEHLSAVARRLKGEFNENSKIPAYYEEIPELNHNAQQGLECVDSLKKSLQIIILQSPLYHPRNQLRAQIIQQTFSRQNFSIQTIDVPGNNLTSSICQGVVIGDYISVYLAFLLGKDPVPFTAIEELKGMLKTGEYVEEILMSVSK